MVTLSICKKYIITPCLLISILLVMIKPVDIFGTSLPQTLTYNNSNLGIKINYLSNWRIEENTNQVIFILPEDTASNSSPLLIIEKSQQQDISLQINDIKKLPYFKLVKFERGSRGDITLSYAYLDPTYGHLGARTFLLPFKNNLYEITYAAKPEIFSNYNELVEDALKSLKFY